MVVILISDLDKSSGGPPWSVYKFYSVLSELDTDLFLLSGSTKNPIVRDSSILFYKSLIAVWKTLYSARILHVQGFWKPSFLLIVAIRAYFCKHSIISPRGMLEDYSFSNSNRFFKRILLYFFKILLNNNYLSFHASSGQEKTSIQKYFLNNRIEVIPNPAGVLVNYLQPYQKREYDFIYVGRIHEKKGLDTLFQSLSEMDDTWNFVIVGDGNSKYVNSLKKLATDLGISGKISWTGFIERDKISDLLNNSKCFLYPTFSENFGNVVPEALSHGVPVVTLIGSSWETNSEDGLYVFDNVNDMLNEAFDLVRNNSINVREISIRSRKFLPREVSKLYKLFYDSV